MAQAQLCAVGIHQVDVGNELRVLRRIKPCLVAIGVLLRGAVAGSDRSDLQAEHRAPDLELECVAKLGSGVAEVVLHPLPLGFAHLPYPAVLQDGERRQQDQQRRGDQGES